MQGAGLTRTMKRIPTIHVVRVPRIYRCTLPHCSGDQREIVVARRVPQQLVDPVIVLVPGVLNRISDLVQDFRVQSSGFKVQGSGFRVQGSGFRVQGSGFGHPPRRARQIPSQVRETERACLRGRHFPHLCVRICRVGTHFPGCKTRRSRGRGSLRGCGGCGDGCLADHGECAGLCS